MNAQAEGSSAAGTDSPDAQQARLGASPWPLGGGVAAVIVVAGILLFLASLSLWIDRQVFNNKQWTDVSTQVIEQPAVQNALANYLVDQLFDSVNVEDEIRDQIPKDWEVLASPATSALRSLTMTGTKKLLELPVTQQAWAAASSTAHETLIEVLEGGNEGVSTTDGVVTINARTILEQAADKLGLSGKLIQKIPADAGTFEIYRSQDLAAAQRAYKVATSLKWIFALLALALYVLAIALAAQRRRRAVAWSGVSFVVVALLLLIAQSLGRGPVVDALAQTSSVEPAVSEVYGIATALLVRMASSLLVTGLLVVAASTLAGPWRWAVGTRRFLAPYLRDWTAASAGAAALLYLIVLWLVPISGFRTTSGLLLNTLLVIAGFVSLVMITRREFPDAAPTDFRPAGAWISGHFTSARDFVRERAEQIELPRRGGGERSQEVAAREVSAEEAATLTAERPSAAQPSAAQPTGGFSDDQLAKLERLQKLRSDGTLSDAEFATLKQQLLEN